MHATYNELAKYYDLIFSQKNYQKEVNFILEIIHKRNVPHKSILDVGCGTGKHLGMLQGFFEDLQGIDLSEKILAVARKNHPRINFCQGNMANFNINKKFDVITCLYSVFNYNLTSNDAVKTVNNFKKHLNKKGMLVLALYTPHNTEKRLTMHAGKNEEVEVVKFNQYKYIPQTKMTEDTFVVLSKDKNGKVDFMIEPDHKYRIFQIEEIREIFAKAGLVNIEIYDDFTRNTANKISEYPIAIANLS